MRLRALAAALIPAAVLLATLAAPAEACPHGKKCKNPAPAPQLVQRTYPVADLVVPINRDLCSDQPFDDRTQEDQLIELIRTPVAPASWGCGGRGTIQYYPLGMALV